MHTPRPSPLARFVALPLLLSLSATSVLAQIRIVAANPATDEVALGAAYVQNFNTLPTSASLVWTDNTTLKGWYANRTAGQVSTGNMVATSLTTISAVTVGSVGGGATLNSLGTSGSTGRALGGTPSAYTTGTTNIFSSQSVNVVLRFKNSTGGVLTGMRVAYDTVATSTANKDAVAFAYRIFSAGAGTISSNFIETHRYLNTYNGNYNESMRTEFGRRVSSASGWTAVVKDVAPTTSGSLTDNLSYNLKDLAVNPGDEVWLAWHVAKEDEQGASDPVTTTAIDNVTVSDFTVGRPGLPVITTHPRSLAVVTGGTRDFTLSVAAKGAATLGYQWRKDGAEIPGATSATYAALNVNSTYEGTYDVVVSTASGSVTSLPAKVNIYAKAAITTVLDVSFAAHSSSVSQLAAATGGTLCDLYYPTSLPGGSTNVPAMIVIHGGGGNNGDKSDGREVEAAQELAARGWFVMVINYAMSSSTVQCWPYNLWDAKQAVRWLKQKADAGTYKIDKAKIGVLGFSWGCNMASMLAMTGPADDVGVSSSSLKVEPPARGNAYDNYTNDVQCSAVFYGAADLPNYHQMNQFLNFTAWDNRTLYRRASPIKYPNPSAAPMLVAHGSADDDVWQSQTETIYMMQKSQGADVEPYLQVPGGEHSFGLFEDVKVATGFPNPIDVRPETIGFFEKHLVDPTRRPSIISEPGSRIAANAATATFNVAAIGTPAPSFQWRKDGVSIPSATSATYSVAASPAAAGYYDVIVTNSAGSLTSTAALLTVQGAVVPAAPIANADSGVTAFNTPATVAVLSNDTDQNGDSLSVTAVTQPSNGSVIINSSATVTYTPTTGFFGTDSFTYTISDGNAGSATATVTITVNALASTTVVTVTTEATVESGTNAAASIDEATLGYISTKYSATGTKRKAYFQFDVSALAVDNVGTATFTIRFTNSYIQRVQLWALNQSYAGFTAAATWNDAQANDTTNNSMLSGATVIGSSAMLQPGASPYTPATFTIPNIGTYVQGGKVTLVLTGVDVTPADTTAGLTNNASGARYTRAAATLTVPTAGNTAPTINDISNRTITEDGATSVIDFTVGDTQTAAANLAVTVATSDPVKVPLDGIILGGTGSDRTIQVNGGPDQVGQSAITVTVTDAGGLSASDSFVVTLTAVNDAPAISDIIVLSTAVNTSTNAASFNVSDIETSSAALSLTGASSNPTLLPLENIIFGGSDGERTITLTPATDKIGTSLVTVVVNDGAATTSDSFTFTVTATPLQTWWISKFGTTNTTSGSSAYDFDAEGDGLSSLLEYAFGGDPALSDSTTLSPTIASIGNTLKFTYRKAAPDLVYSVQNNSDLANPAAWTPLDAGASPETTNGDGTYSVTVPLGGARTFLRLKVTAP